MTTTLLKILINTFIGGVLIFFWLKFVDINQIIKQLSSVNLQFSIPVFIFMFISPSIRAFRLKLFLKPIKDIPLKDLIFLNGIAQMLNFFIPIRAGEIAKGIYLNQVYNLPLNKSLIWIFLDRFIDFLVVLSLIIPFLIFYPTNLPLNIVFLISIILGVALLLIYLMVYKSNFMQKIIKFLIYLLIVDIIKIYFERFVNFSFETLSLLKRTHKEITLFILITVLSYVADGAVWYFSFLSLGSSQDYIKMYFGQLLSALTYLIPAAPGYIGSAEASGLLIFSGVFGINANLASSMTVLFHILTTVFILGFGLISLYFLKIDLSAIFRKALKRA